MLFGSGEADRVRVEQVRLPQRNDVRHLASGIYLLLFEDIETLQEI